MDNLIDKFNKYRVLHSEILKSFDTDGWEPIESNVSSRWHKSEHGDLNWLDESGTEYSYDSADKCGKEVDGYVLFYIRDNGDIFHSMFSSAMESKEYDDYCEQIGVEI